MSTATFLAPMSTPLPAVEAAPSGPARFTRRGVLADDPGRVAAFVFDVDTLIDAKSYEAATARATARRIAARRGLSSMWLEVMAVELASDAGGEQADAVLRALAGDAGEPGDGDTELTPEVLAAIRPAAGVAEALGQVHRRFKLGVVSSRSQLDTMRILRALDLLDRFDAGAFVDPDRAGVDAVCQRAIDLLAEPAEQCVLIGPVGAPTLRAAGQIGMQAIGLASRKGASPGVIDFNCGGLVLTDMSLVEALACGATSVYDRDDQAS